MGLLFCVSASKYVPPHMRDQPGGAEIPPPQGPPPPQMAQSPPQHANFTVPPPLPPGANPNQLPPNMAGESPRHPKLLLCFG